jgi:hypothetical protein
VVFLVTVRGNAPAVGCTNVGAPNPPLDLPGVVAVRGGAVGAAECVALPATEDHLLIGR